MYDSLNNTIVTSAKVNVLQTDTTSPFVAHGTTGASGSLVFSLDDATYPVDVGAPGYFQETAYQLVTVSGSGTDTIWVYTPTITAPGNSDSCTLVFYLPSVEYRVIITPELSGEGDKTTTGYLIDPKPAVADPNASTLIAQKSVLRSSGSSPSLGYTIEVVKKYNKEVLFELNGYTVPDSTSHVVTW